MLLKSLCNRHQGYKCHSGYNAFSSSLGKKGKTVRKFRMRREMLDRHVDVATDWFVTVNYLVEDRKLKELPLHLYQVLENQSRWFRRRFTNFIYRVSLDPWDIFESTRYLRIHKEDDFHSKKIILLKSSYFSDGYANLFI